MGKKIAFRGQRQKHFVKEWRLYRGLTMEQLADRIGTSKVSISRIESGEQPYTEESLHAIADALSATPSDLLSRDPSVPPPISMQGLPKGDADRVVGFINALRTTRVDLEGNPSPELPDTPRQPAVVKARRKKAAP